MQPRFKRLLEDSPWKHLLEEVSKTQKPRTQMEGSPSYSPSYFLCLHISVPESSKSYLTEPRTDLSSTRVPWRNIRRTLTDNAKPLPSRGNAAFLGCRNIWLLSWDSSRRYSWKQKSEITRSCLLKDNELKMPTICPKQAVLKQMQMELLFWRAA